MLFLNRHYKLICFVQKTQKRIDDDWTSWIGEKAFVIKTNFCVDRVTNGWHDQQCKNVVVDLRSGVMK